MPYINIRKVGGNTLDALVHAEPAVRLQPEYVKGSVRTLLRICDAQAYAHSRSVVHLDLKTSNIMVREFGVVYLVHWGVAMTNVGTFSDEPVRVSTSRVTSTVPAASRLSSSLSGTPAYMAPEQAAGHTSDVEPRTDVFLVGATLYHVLSGSPPYSGASTLAEVLQLAERGNYTPIESFNGQHRASPTLIEIVNTAMRAEPENRFQSMLELRSSLERFVEGVGYLASEHYKAGEVIVREDEPGARAFIILSSRCHVYCGDDAALQTLREIGAANVFGEMAILSGGIRTPSVAPLTNVEVEIVTRENLNIGLGVKTWAGKFITALADRFIEVDRQARAKRS